MIAIGVQIAITVTLFLLLCFWENHYRFGGVLGVVFFVALVWQSAMLGFWAGLGHGPWRWPIVIALAFLPGLAAGLAEGELLEFEVFCVSITAIVAVTTSGLRYWKGDLQRVDFVNPPAEALQFSILQVFLFTTGAAVVFALIRFLIATYGLIDVNNRQFELLLLIVALSACLAFSIVINIWAILGDRITLGRIAVVIVVAMAAAYGSYYTLDDSFFAAVSIASQIPVLITIFLLRWQQLRFVKRQG